MRNRVTQKKVNMSKKMVGYDRRDSISHRRYNWSTSVSRYKKTGNFTRFRDGSGHRAGEAWADEKNINPESSQTKYGKNSPSFDEGVWLSKQKRKIADKI